MQVARASSPSVGCGAALARRAPRAPAEATTPLWRARGAMPSWISLGKGKDNGCVHSLVAAVCLPVDARNGRGHGYGDSSIVTAAKFRAGSLPLAASAQGHLSRHNGNCSSGAWDPPRAPTTKLRAPVWRIQNLVCAPQRNPRQRLGGPSGVYETSWQTATRHDEPPSHSGERPWVSSPVARGGLAAGSSGDPRACRTPPAPRRSTPDSARVPHVGPMRRDQWEAWQY